jgi:1-acyl-sn-glycerol-3-phosphate acyltransferase
MSLFHTIQGIFNTGRISVPTVVDSALGRLSLEKCDERLDWWAHRILRDSEMDLVVRGREHAEGSEPFVVMSNHQSLYDIPVLFCAMPGRIRMVAKAELFKVPIWGKAMLASGFIRIDRSDRAEAVASLRAGASMLKAGTRIWIAPEGTRSVTGALGPFKSGGFRMALETGTRILPVAIDGTRLTLPARGTAVQLGHRTVVTILPPIDPRPYGEAGRKELMDDVRAAIQTALDGAPAPSPSSEVAASA